MGEDETRQLRFEDGELVDAGGIVPGSGCDAAVDPVEPGEASGFRVAVRQGALTANDGLAAVVADHGRELEFGSRTAAEDFAQRRSADGGGLRVQAAAPNDDSDVDAYLLAAHDPATHEPASVDGDTWTYDVGANLYGHLGEAIVTGPPGPMALRHFVEQDLGDAAVDLTVEAGTPLAVETPDGVARWTPDCVVVARDGPSGPVRERYRCEVKTGDASRQRTQSAAMRRLAETGRVLVVRVDVRDLPDRYSVRVREVDPESGG